MLTKSKAGEKKMKYQDWDCKGQTRWLEMNLLGKVTFRGTGGKQ